MTVESIVPLRHLAEQFNPSTSQHSKQQDVSPLQAAQAAAAKAGTTFPNSKPRHGMIFTQQQPDSPNPFFQSTNNALPPLPLHAMRPAPTAPASQHLRSSLSSLDPDQTLSTARSGPGDMVQRTPSNQSTTHRRVQRSGPSQTCLSRGSTMSMSRKGPGGAFSRGGSKTGTPPLPLALQALLPSNNRQTSRVHDDEPGEARRYMDGRALSMLDTLDHDDDELASGALSYRSGSTAQDVYALLSYRHGLLGHKGSVEAHQRRMKEREEVVRTLTTWTQEVLTHRAPTVQDGDVEHVDAEQLELEERCTDPSMRPDPQGVGYQLRAHWNATVQEAVEIKFAQMRDKWDADMAIEMEELRELRVKNKELSGGLRDAKDKLVALQMKFDLVMRQSRPTIAAPAPAPPPTPPPEEKLPVMSPEAMAAAAGTPVPGTSVTVSRSVTSGGVPETQEVAGVTAADVQEFVAEIERLRAALSAAKKEHADATKNATEVLATLESTVEEKEKTDKELSKTKTDVAMLTMKLGECKDELDKTKEELEKQKKLAKLGAGGTAANSKGRGPAGAQPPAKEPTTKSKPPSAAKKPASASPSASQDATRASAATSKGTSVGPHSRQPVSEGSGAGVPGGAGGGGAGQEGSLSSPRARDSLAGTATATGGGATAPVSAPAAPAGPDPETLARLSLMQRERDQLLEESKVMSQLLEDRNREMRQLMVEVAELKARSPRSKQEAVPTTNQPNTIVKGDPVLMARAAKAEAELKVARSHTEELEAELVKTRKELEEARASPVTANQLEVAVEVERTRRKQLLEQLRGPVSSALVTAATDPDILQGVANKLQALISQYSVGLDDVGQAAPRTLGRGLSATTTTPDSRASAAGGRVSTVAGGPRAPLMRLKAMDLQGLLANSNAKLQQLYELGGRLDAGLPSAEEALLENPLLPDMATDGSAQPNSYSHRLNAWLSNAFGAAAGPTGRVSMAGAAMQSGRASVSGAIAYPARMSVSGAGAAGLPARNMRRSGEETAAGGPSRLSMLGGPLGAPRIRSSHMGAQRPSMSGAQSELSVAAMMTSPAQHAQPHPSRFATSQSPPSLQPSDRDLPTAHNVQAPAHDVLPSPAHGKRMSVMGDESVTVARRSGLIPVAASAGPQGLVPIPPLPLGSLAAGSTQDEQPAAHSLESLSEQQEPMASAPEEWQPSTHQDYDSVSGAGQPGVMVPRFTPPTQDPASTPGRQPVRVYTSLGHECSPPPGRPQSARPTGTLPPSDIGEHARPMTAAPAGIRPGTFARMHASYLGVSDPPPRSAQPSPPDTVPPSPAIHSGSTAGAATHSQDPTSVAGGQQDDPFPLQVVGVSRGRSAQPPASTCQQAVPTDQGLCSATSAQDPRQSPQWSPEHLRQAEDRVSRSPPHTRSKSGGGGVRGGGSGSPRSPAMQSTAKPAQPSELDLAPPSPLVVQQQVGGEPPIMRHNLYQPQPDQPPGAFRVRLITATPQKGIHNPRRPTSPGASPARPTHALSLGLNYEEGQGPPQVAPAPQPAMLSTRTGYTMGLSVPTHTWTLQPSGAPAGAQLHMPGDERPVYSGPELMTRMELVSAVRALQQTMEHMEKRFTAMTEDLMKQQNIRSELAAEVVEARQHWIAENQYNSMLQEELERMQAILEMITHTATDSAGVEVHEPSDEPEACSLPPALGPGRPSMLHLGYHEPMHLEHLDAASPEARQARSLLHDIAELNARQQAHVHQVEVVAENLGLESPSRSHLARSRSLSRTGLTHEDPAQDEGAVRLLRTASSHHLMPQDSDLYQDEDADTN